MLVTATLQTSYAPPSVNVRALLCVQTADCGDFAAGLRSAALLHRLSGRGDSFTSRSDRSIRISPVISPSEVRET